MTPNDTHTYVCVCVCEKERGLCVCEFEDALLLTDVSNLGYQDLSTRNRNSRTQTHGTEFERIKHVQKNTPTPTHSHTHTHPHTHTDVRWETLERMQLSIQIHDCMCTLQSILYTVQRLICNQGAVVIVRQLAQLV